MNEEVKKILKGLTLEQKAKLLYGRKFWYIHGKEASEKLPNIMVTDGPSGLRKQLKDTDMLGLFESVPSTSFPTESCVACSWDPELTFEMGEAMGKECVKENVAVLLGPGVNHKRDPLCGRNFEYFSEDPYLSGKLGAGIVKGVQSQGVGTSLKHFAGNSREDGRQFTDSMIDERALREIYLKQFEIVVKESQPKTVMMAYNRLNGCHCAENERLMTDIARNEWGFEGLFMTDWGAIRGPATAYNAGLDLEMPGTLNSYVDIVEEVNKGNISEAVIDERAAKVIELLLYSQEKKPSVEENLLEVNFEKACKIAEESAVLLKNEGVLPLNNSDDVCVIGAFAKSPRYQGGGSSKTNPYKLDNFMQYVDLPYADGYERNGTEPDEALISEAVKLASRHKNVLLFIGLPEVAESEGYDRKTLDLPLSHTKLAEEVCKVNKNVIVVLSVGSPVTLPFKNDVKAILLTYLAGEAGGKAAYNLLYGIKNPCGKLAETFPVCYEDTPAHNYYKQHEDYDEYRESIFTGYRYYETTGVEVNYPFGYGLSYTKFDYSDLKIENDVISFTLTNTGDRDGKETVQLYISAVNSNVPRASKELKGFKKVYLKAGESKKVSFSIKDIDFSFYNADEKKWQVEEGDYKILIGASVKDIRLNGKVFVRGDKVKKISSVYMNMTKDTVVSQDEFIAYSKLPTPTNRDTTKLNIYSLIKDLKNTPQGKLIFDALVSKAQNGIDISSAIDMPIIGLTLTGTKTRKDVYDIINKANGEG